MSRLSEILNEYMYEVADELTAHQIEHVLKQECPGEYTVRFINGELVLDFHGNDKEQTIFMLMMS